MEIAIGTPHIPFNWDGLIAKVGDHVDTFHGIDWSNIFDKKNPEKNTEVTTCLDCDAVFMAASSGLCLACYSTNTYNTVDRMGYSYFHPVGDLYLEPALTEHGPAPWDPELEDEEEEEDYDSYDEDDF